MNTFIKYLIFSLAFISVGLLVGFKISDRGINQEMISLDDGLEKLRQTIFFVEKNYVKEPNNDKMVDDAIEGILNGLDPHSTYFPVSEMKEMEDNMSGSFDGIGVEFTILEDTIYVVSPLVGGPSEKLGIMAGDRIIKVEGENVAGINISTPDVMRHLKGPKGTKVKVAIMRRGVKDLIDFEIIRDKIPIHSVAYSYMMDESTGYIQVTRFSETTYDEFSDHLYGLLDEGMKNLVLDLRGNPGGYMSMANKMADEFLSAGKLMVSTDGRIPESKQKHISTGSIGAFEQGGLVVLIDYGSASASEIVSGAVQDHDRGLIVGVRSFGKGLVQIQKKFYDGSAIRVVISEYYTPSGRCIQKPYNKSSEEYDREILERFESGEIYDESKITEVPDSLVYKTDAGRTVYGGGGIYPDVFVATDTTGNSRYFTDLTVKDLFRSYAYAYADEHAELSTAYPDAQSFIKGFKIDEAIIQDFVSYAAKHDVELDEKGFNRSKRYISNRLNAYVGRKLYKDDGFFPVFHRLDKQLQRALELMPSAIKLEQTGKLVVSD